MAAAPQSQSQRPRRDRQSCAGWICGIDFVPQLPGVRSWRVSELCGVEECRSCPGSRTGECRCLLAGASAHALHCVLSPTLELENMCTEQTTSGNIGELVNIHRRPSDPVTPVWRADGSSSQAHTFSRACRELLLPHKDEGFVRQDDMLVEMR